MPQELVIFVDNDPFIIFLFEKAARELDLADGSFRSFRNGRDAIRYLSETSVDKLIKKQALVITDLNLPGEDGLNLLRWIKEHGELSSLPVVIITSNLGTFSKDAVKSFCALGIFEKQLGYTANLEILKKALVLRKEFYSSGFELAG